MTRSMLERRLREQVLAEVERESVKFTEFLRSMDLEIEALERATAGYEPAQANIQDMRSRLEVAKVEFARKLAELRDGLTS